MSFDGRLEHARLTVALDIRHPFAFLALRPAVDLGRELSLEINWLPIAAPPLKPPSQPTDHDDRGARHKRHRARMIAREIAIYSDAQGRTVREPYRDGPAVAAHLGWLWMREQGSASLEPFLEELFRRYWALQVDVADPEGVACVVEACGGDGSAFRAWARTDGLQVASEIAGALAAVGVFQSPAYLVEGEVFYGRQHLPMIRWILEGRHGFVPI